MEMWLESLLLKNPVAQPAWEGLTAEVAISDVPRSPGGEIGAVVLRQAGVEGASDVDRVEGRP